MSLNPEPAAPEERAELDLPPKSYADAAEEALEPSSHANGTDGTMEQTMQRLRRANGIKIPSQQDVDSLEGIGQDASPKSPTVKGHRRKGSRSSMGSVGRKHGEQIDTEVFQKHPDGHSEALISVKPSQDFEKDQRIDVRRRNSELKSGRQAGAGWAKSKCVWSSPMHHCVDD